MKILFAIQATGNGHISRAREIVPLLEKHGQVDLLVSGTQADVTLDQPLAYRFHGFSFIFGKKGGVNNWKTYRHMNLFQLRKDITSLPLKQYDLIINDFEPVTAWGCRLQGLPSVSLSHQASFISKKTPRPPNSFNWAELIFRYYAPTTHHIGFHFKPYDDFIHTPVIRSEIRNQESTDCGHITVYLPSFDDKHLLPYLQQIPEVKWEVFSKHSQIKYRQENVWVNPVSNQEFNHSLVHSHGLLTGGGFEGPSEALFLGKKVMMIPMKNQFEQQCNAEAARQMGVPVLHHLDHESVPALRRWLSGPFMVQTNFLNETEQIVNNLVKKYSVSGSFLSSGLLY
ncbi:glycosyl transferase [Flavihumibacter sp. R14]|nr:glycosyl transferase [Flavihumibacter soli]